MNPMIKIAYEYGQRKCLEDLGLTKGASPLADLALAGPILGAAVGGGIGSIDAINSPEDRQASRALHGMIGGGVGGLTGGAIGLLGGQLAKTHFKSGVSPAVVALLGGSLGGLYGGAKLVQDSHHADSILDRLRG